MRPWLCFKALVFIGFLTSSLLSAADAAKAPNILWILTDDHRPDSLACFNEAVSRREESALGYVSSPNADKLAREGVLFTQAYSNAPSCAPSRASMFTGQYPFRNGIYGFESWRRKEFVPVLIPEVMDEAGYNTLLDGKFDVRINKEKPPSAKGDVWFDTHFDAFIDRSLLKSVNYTTGAEYLPIYSTVDGTRYLKERYYFPDGHMDDITVSTPGGLTPEQQEATSAFEKKYEILRCYQRQSGPYLIIGGESTMPKEGGYHSELNKVFFDYLQHPNSSFSLACDPELVFNGPNPDDPIFVNIGYEWPHTPVLPPKEVRDQFKDKTYRIPEFSHDELRALPPQLQKFYQRFAFDKMTDDEKQQAVRDYYAFCAYGDWLIGQAVEAFKQYSEKQSRPWVIIYTVGDHAWHIGENGVTGKFGPYNKSNRCAIIAVSSDKSVFPSGVVCDDLVEFVDLAPTFYALAGVNLSAEKYRYLDGYPLMDILKGKRSREYVLNETNHVYEHRASIRDKDFVFSMRTRPTGYLPIRGLQTDNIKWALEAPDADVEMALFDLRTDPLERHNVAKEEEYADLIQWFRQKLGNIVLGDRRIEYNWTRWREDDQYAYYDFAAGTDDKKLSIPPSIIPPVTH